MCSLIMLYFITRFDNIINGLKLKWLLELAIQCKNYYSSNSVKEYCFSNLPHNNCSSYHLRH